MKGPCGDEFRMYDSHCERECNYYETCVSLYKKALKAEEEAAQAQGDNHPVLPIKDENRIKYDIISNKNKFKSLPKILEGELMAFKEDLKTLTIDTLIRQLELY